MAQTLLTVTKMTRAGILPAQENSDEANGNKLPLSGFDFLEIENTGGAPYTVTFDAQSADPRGNQTNKTVSITNGTKTFIGPFQKADWDDGTGHMLMAYSVGASTNLKIRGMKLLVSSPATETET